MGAARADKVTERTVSAERRAKNDMVKIGVSMGRIKGREGRGMVKDAKQNNGHTYMFVGFLIKDDGSVLGA